MSFKQGERVFAKGQPSDYAFLILSGRVEIVLDRANGAEVLATIGTGEVFGEMGLIDNGPRSASARAAADTVCLAITADELLKMIETDPKEAVAFVKTLIRRLRAANARLISPTPSAQPAALAARDRP
ncbi:MAG: cyclic nucleotide-binding domain-containing protein [Rhodospirillales bacterium]|nr:cyclic nucleotide-binding domain-containing protein [Rhodospirillales bacterium]